ncbi:hypothetical protein J2Y66_003647 [Paenarthrobacter nitroguajacolicus]|uniref:hypothetical protein n=1 Tax=Paenarthrobacter nitroguajacolicus TaxID=211146 RepID=UPI002866831E|nr:hypothetical protein [Paenarthrobacter nitroguajacolicus]MDR6989132.1 hypothetical protein [Paenarthrobacter nitroguajacolicus]
MNIRIYLGLLHQGEQTLAESFRQVSEGHSNEPDIHFICQTLAKQCENHGDLLLPIVQRYGEATPDNEPERLHAQGLMDTRSGPVGLLRDLQDLYLLASFVDITWTAIEQAGQALRDHDLLVIVESSQQDTKVQLRWLQTRMKQAAPQTLIAARPACAFIERNPTGPVDYGGRDEPHTADVTT